jgi:hypothetical protein
MSRSYSKAIGIIAGNIIAAMPTVQVAVNKEIDIGSYSILALIMTLLLSATDCLLSKNHDTAEVKIRRIRIIVWTLFSFNTMAILSILHCAVKINFIVMN